jgi:hypothetical protein
MGSDQVITFIRNHLTSPEPAKNGLTDVFGPPKEGLKEGAALISLIIVETDEAGLSLCFWPLKRRLKAK